MKAFLRDWGAFIFVAIMMVVLLYAVATEDDGYVCSERADGTILCR